MSTLSIAAEVAHAIDPCLPRRRRTESRAGKLRHMADADGIEVLALNGHLGERVRALWEGNLSRLDWERDFLAPFRERRAAVGYIGMGKTLSALNGVARLYGGAAAELRERITAELLAAQEDSGYLGILAGERRTYRMWDAHEQGYLLQALAEAWEWFADVGARDGAARLAAWLLPRLAGGRWRQVADGTIWHPIVLLGVDRGMLRVAEVTGDPAYRRFVEDDLGVRDWCAPIVEGREGAVEGHAYAYLGRCLAQLELNRDSSAGALPRASAIALSYLRVGGGLTVSGACGQGECWHSDQQVDGKLGETCATAYLIRWAGHLLRRTGDSYYADLIERAMYNALFAANSLDGRKIRYYSPASGPRLWHPADTYCCPGNYRRIVAELPSLIAHRTDDGLALDLYETCRLRAFVGAVAVELDVESGLPWSGTVAIEVDAPEPVRFTLRLRRPGWAESAVVAVNGSERAAADASGWFAIDRTWARGDRVEIALHMPWRLVRGFRRQRGRVAVMRGPVVYATTEAGLGAGGTSPADAAPDVASCRMQDGSGHGSIDAELPDGQLVPLTLVPFSDPRVTETYFRGVAGAGDRRDSLLDVEVPAVGTPPAPGA